MSAQMVCFFVLFLLVFFFTLYSQYDKSICGLGDV